MKVNTGRWNTRRVVRKCCPMGHPYDETNTYSDPTLKRKACRTCRKRRAKGQS